MKNPRTKHSPTFKAKVALDALREQETVAEIARRHKVHANMVYKWRQVALENLSLVFEPESAAGGPTAEREAELLLLRPHFTNGRCCPRRGVTAEFGV